MQQPRSSRSVLPFKPRVSELARIIREAAKESLNVAFSKYARERLIERSISDLEALRALRIGEIKGEVEAGTSAGEWKCKVVAPIVGSREIGVVTIVMINGQLFVKTVEWEDL